MWEPIVALADLAGEDWPERARAAAIEMIKAGNEREVSLGVRLLTDLRIVFEDSEALASEVIVQKLILLDESPWGDLRGRPLDQRGLARRLRQYDVKSKKFRTGPDTTARGYLRADLHDVWERYCSPPPDGSGTSGTAGTGFENAKENRSTYEHPERNKRNTERNTDAPVPVDVPHNVPHVPDRKPQAEQITHCNKRDVPDVPDLPLPRGNGDGAAYPPVCSHCGEPEQPDDPVQRCLIDGEEHLLHRRCQDEWLGLSADPADYVPPEFLRRGLQ